MNAYITNSKTDTSTTYVLEVSDSGARSCTCPGAKHHGYCKHLAALDRYLTNKQRQMEAL